MHPEAPELWDRLAGAHHALRDYAVGQAALARRLGIEDDAAALYRLGLLLIGWDNDGTPSALEADARLDSQLGMQSCKPCWARPTPQAATWWRRCRTKGRGAGAEGSSALDTLGWAYAQAGYLFKAEDNLLKALDASPQFGPAPLHLGKPICAGVRMIWLASI